MTLIQNGLRANYETAYSIIFSSTYIVSTLRHPAESFSSFSPLQRPFRSTILRHSSDPPAQATISPSDLFKRRPIPQFSTSTPQIVQPQRTTLQTNPLLHFLHGPYLPCTKHSHTQLDIMAWAPPEGRSKHGETRARQPKVARWRKVKDRGIKKLGVGA